MRILNGATRVTAAVVCSLVFVGVAPAYADQPASPAVADQPAVADDPVPPAAPDMKSSAPTDAPPPDAAVPVAAAPTPVPHLVSPENLPPYTTTTSDGAQGSDRLSYLQDVWRAVQDHEISPKQALVLLAQRPMDADVPAGVAAGPQAPVPGPQPVPDAPDAP